MGNPGASGKLGVLGAALPGAGGGALQAPPHLPGPAELPCGQGELSHCGRPALTLSREVAAAKGPRPVRRATPTCAPCLQQFRGCTRGRGIRGSPWAPRSSGFTPRALASRARLVSAAASPRRTLPGATPRCWKRKPGARAGPDARGSQGGSWPWRPGPARPAARGSGKRWGREPSGRIL